MLTTRSRSSSCVRAIVASAAIARCCGRAISRSTSRVTTGSVRRSAPRCPPVSWAMPITTATSGGYASFGDKVRTPELLMRWAELAALTPVMRSHEGNRPDANLQIDSAPEILAHYAAMTRLHAGLAPYVRTLASESARNRTAAPARAVFALSGRSAMQRYSRPVSLRTRPDGGAGHRGRRELAKTLSAGGHARKRAVGAFVEQARL